MKMRLPSLLQLEGLVPIMAIIATDSGITCDVHHFGCGNALLLEGTTHGSGRLLHLWEIAPYKMLAFSFSGLEEHMYKMLLECKVILLKLTKKWLAKT